MTKEYTYKGLKWLDLENPTDDEVNGIIAGYNVPIQAAEDLLSPTPKQRVVMYANCVYIVLHFPTLTPNKSSKSGAYNHRQEIDFIIGKDFLITVHYDSVRSLDKFKKSLASEPSEEGASDNAGFIFHKLIKHLYHSLLTDVEIIRAALGKAENFVFKGEEKKMVIELSRIHRDILRFQSALLPHREAISLLQGMFREFLGQNYEYFIHDMSSEYQRVDRRMQSNKELLEELRHTNDSLLSAKQNEAIKGLTMMAFITFPLTLIATLFGMNAKYTPIVGGAYDFWIIIAILLSVMLICIGFLSYKKWL
ncbi:MAG: CorA family divalent cation transporter [Patescibacteria group bacterium]